MNKKLPVGVIIDRPIPMGNTLKNSKGITLVALVITIIILLILAGVTLNIVFNGGLIEKSQTAVDTYSKEQAREKVTLLALQYKFRKLSGEETTFEKIVEEAEGTATYDETEKIYIVNLEGYEFEVDGETFEILGGNKGENQETETPDDTEPPVTVGKDNTEGTTHTKIGSGDYAYNNPVIPAGFETVETDLASWASTNGTTVDDWNNGLVIQDGSGNQFVWVPVDGTNVTYEKWTSSTNGTPTATNTSDDSLPSGISSEDTQITTYGGFYIARYEAGIPSTLTTALTNASATYRNVSGKPVSKQSQVPWNYIDYSTAKANAESMYSTNYVQSGLVTGTQWDTTMKWLENAGYNVQTNSTGWGNYFNAAVTKITQYSTNYGASWTSVDSTTKGTSTSCLLKTGHSEYTNSNNIYDLAGNLWETTNELYSSSSCVLRGGNHDFNGSNFPAAYRYSVAATDTSNVRGFRVGLYIK